MINLIIEGKIKEFEQAVVKNQSAMPFLSSPKIVTKSKILSILSIVNKSMVKSIDISYICENIGIDRNACDILIMKCIRLKYINGYIDDSEGKLIVDKIASLYLDNPRIEEINTKIDKMLKMVNMVEQAILVGSE